MNGQPQAPTVRVTSLLRNRTWLALAPLGAIAFGLAYWGFGQLDPKFTDFERIEKAAQLVKGAGTYSFPRDPWQLVLAQWLVPLVALVTAAKLFLASLRRDLRLAFARRSRDHVIVCGLGHTGRRIVEILRARGERVLAIDLDADSANARAAESLGTPTIPGDAKTVAVLHLAGVRRARMLVACTGDDTANLEIALSAADDASAYRSSGRLTVVPEMRADWLFERLISRSGASLGSAAAEVRILNTAENAGRLLCRASAFMASAILQPERSDLAIIGFGDMGRAIASHAFRTVFALPGRRMRLQVFDARGDAAAKAFAALNPGIEAVADLIASEAKITSGKPESWEPIRAGLEGGQLAALIVCLPDEREALYGAVRARETLDGLGERAVPVFVRVAGRRKLADVIARTDPAPWPVDRFVPFGDLADLLSAAVAEDDADVLARACHLAYLETLKEGSDAPSSRPWDQLPELFKRSNRLFADHLEVKLRAAGLRSCPAEAPRPFEFTPADLETLSAAEHWRWLVERRIAGWQYSAVRDDAGLRHPLLREWEDLPDEARKSVRTVVARIPAILAHTGREIRRERVVGLGAAKEALDGFDPNGAEHLVLAVDPADPDAGSLARRALAVSNLTLRLVPGRSGRMSAPGFSDEELDRLRSQTEGSLDDARIRRDACGPG